jgi:hypothetical protein
LLPLVSLAWFAFKSLRICAGSIPGPKSFRMRPCSNPGPPSIFGNPGPNILAEYDGITNLQLGALVSPLAGLKSSITPLPLGPQSN